MADKGREMRKQNRFRLLDMKTRRYKSDLRCMSLAALEHKEYSTSDINGKGRARV